MQDTEEQARANMFCIPISQAPQKMTPPTTFQNSLGHWLLTLAFASLRSCVYLHMTWTQLAIVLPIVLCVNALIVIMHFKACASAWNDLANKYPVNAAAILESAETKWREFQSISIDFFNLGFCAHLRLDQTHLHMAPAWFMRKLGAKPMSIPREALANSERRRVVGVIVQLGGTQLKLPKWIMPLPT